MQMLQSSMVPVNVVYREHEYMGRMLTNWPKTGNALVWLAFKINGEPNLLVKNKPSGGDKWGVNVDTAAQLSIVSPCRVSGADVGAPRSGRIGTFRKGQNTEPSSPVCHTMWQRHIAAFVYHHRESASASHRKNSPKTKLTIVRESSWSSTHN